MVLRADAFARQDVDLKIVLGEINANSDKFFHGRSPSLWRSSRPRFGSAEGRRGMRYPASEKLEIIRLVEQSHLPVRRTLEKLGVSRATFYRRCDLSQTGGPQPWKTDLPGRTASGTEFLTMCVARSCNWRWMSRSCRRGSWPRASPTRKAILSRRLRSIPVESYHVQDAAEAYQAQLREPEDGKVRFAMSRWKTSSR
jgi:hypothetical protein